MDTITQDQLKISFGNKKLPKSMMIFNLPAIITCPLKTPLCSKSCYALKAERLYPATLPARQHNLALVRKGLFKQLMIEAIAENYKKINIIRLHESGDFYSQSYLNDWFVVAREYPELTFYAYTKSFHLTFKAKPANFVLIASLDDTTDKKRQNKFLRQARYFDNMFIIVNKKTKATCKADCNRCNICWTKKGLGITVNKH